MLTGRRIAIIGSGVIGLSVANRLLAHNATLTLFSPQPLSEITSSVAAAYWAPYWVGDYDRNIAIQTLSELQGFAREGVNGVCELPFEEWLTEEGARELTDELDISYWWRNLPGINFVWEPMPQQRSCMHENRNVDFVQRVRFSSVVARMPDYLAWLKAQLDNAKRVRFERRWIDSFDDVCRDFDDVVNCSGWGAKTLVKNDTETASMRLLAGHVVIIDAPEIRTAVSLHRSPFRGAPVYIVPRRGSRQDVLCGGTAIEVTESLDSRQPLTFLKASQCDDVILRASGVLTEVAGRPELDRGVGIRPMRRSVRIERDARQKNLVHCCGHGGAGLTLSWGSADQVVKLLRQGLASDQAK